MNIKDIIKDKFFKQYSQCDENIARANIISLSSDIQTELRSESEALRNQS